MIALLLSIDYVNVYINPKIFVTCPENSKLNVKMQTFSYILLIMCVMAVLGHQGGSANQSRNLLSPYLNRKYKLTYSDDNFHEIMKALEVGYLKRKLALIASPVMELTEQNGVYTLSNVSTFKNFHLSFRMNEEFEETTPDDRVVRTTFTQDGNKLIQVQRGKDGRIVTVTREFTPDKVIVTTQYAGIVSTRIYTPVD